MAFEMTAKMKEVKETYGSTHGYQINKQLSIPDVSVAFYVPL